MVKASKKVLIIGIDSFTGKHLSLYLKNSGYEIFGTHFVAEGKTNIYKCDITNKYSIFEIINKLKPDYIINLAGISFVFSDNKELFYKVNVLAVENILESILEVEEYKPKKVILASSATVYGNQRENILHENMIPNPVNHYGVSKLAMEQISKNYFDKLDIIITRPFNYTGIGQEDQFLVPKIIKNYKENKKEIELGNIDVSREFNDIYFVCEAYKRLLKSDIKSEIYNICSGRGIKLLEIIDIMNNIAGYKINIKVNLSLVRENEIKKLVGSSDKLFMAVNKIENIDFKDTLLKMYGNKDV